MTMKNCGNMSMLRQDAFDDGVQQLMIVFEDGSRIKQTREWPTLKYRDSETGDSLHEVVYLSEAFETLAKVDVDAAYELVCKCSRLIKGPELTSETTVIAEPAPEVPPSIEAPEIDVEVDAEANVEATKEDEL